MGRMIKYRKKDNKYRIWTTFSDKYFTDWITREEALKILVAERKRDFDDQIKTLRENFPYGYMDPKTRKTHTFKGKGV